MIIITLEHQELAIRCTILGRWSHVAIHDYWKLMQSM